MRHVQDAAGQWRLPAQHAMSKRQPQWHYRWRGVYMITLTLADRSRPLLGELVGERIILSALGKAVEAAWRGIGAHVPAIEPLVCQVMPDHFHGILRVREELAKPLGEAIRGFKIACTQAYRAMNGAGLAPPLAAHIAPPPGAPPPTGAPPTASQVPVHSCAGASLWSPGYQDSIAFSEERLARMVAYVKDNPRRLALKCAHRDLFRVLTRLPFQGGHLCAIGNRFLLDSPAFFQVQCSRSIAEADLQALRTRCLHAATHGATIVSPCLSPGERLLAKAAFEAKAPLIVLKNKGFAPCAKPAGAYFDACAEGRLLMLAPAAWPYVAGRSPITRLEACVLNRLAQRICGQDAAPIHYHGITPAHLDRALAQALQATHP